LASLAPGVEATWKVAAARGGAVVHANKAERVAAAKTKNIEMRIDRFYDKTARGSWTGRVELSP
jgi:hypothetical protein